MSTKLPLRSIAIRPWKAPLATVKGWPRRARQRREGEGKGEAKGRSATEMTVREFWEWWTTDPLFARPKESTNIHDRERTRGFVGALGDLKLADVGDHLRAQWLRGGTRNSTVPALRAMFNDARSAEAGRLIDTNPFAGLRITKSKGRKGQQPPTIEQMESMVRIAKELTPPSFAAYCQFASVIAGRPGELDALTWPRVRFEDGEVDLFEQFSAKTGKFTTPKYGPYTIALVGRARDVLLAMPRQGTDSPFVFVTTRGTYYTPSSRTHHWNRVR